VEVGLTVPPTIKGLEDTYADDPVLTAIVEARNNAPYFQLYYDQFLSAPLAAAILDAAETVFAGAASPEEAAQAIEDVAAVELSG
ncbi:MAG: ABC transporter substrate-binding protein, partial [Anaerolineae bacterium]|nr:ABC transporter substrate-binding protein [Anaerolineae bacterium]